MTKETMGLDDMEEVKRRARNIIKRNKVIFDRLAEV